MELSSFRDWELKRRLGTGGFGEVTLWKNRITEIEIATKRLKGNDRLSEDEVSKLKQRWLQEYEWMRNLNTSFIVRGMCINDEAFVAYLNEHHVWSPLPVIIMEYCNAGDVRTHLQKAENLNGLHEFEVCEIMRALRHAVEYLHNQCKIEHRDLKPDNIVIHQTGQKRCYKLTDFGFARNTSDNTILKSVVGTRHYFAPEVVDTAQYTNTVDYWSLGVIAYELMCGITPFIPHQVMYQIIFNIKKKPAMCIAITESLDTPNQFEYQTDVTPENRMSHIFLAKMVKWLRLSLDTNYRTRGTSTLAASNVAQRLVDKNGRILTFYTELDATLDSKILTVFCLTTFRFYYYEITDNVSMRELFEGMATDSHHECKQLFLVFPTGHRHGQLTADTKPIDFFQEDWQDTSDKHNPPVMLYLLGLQCDYNASQPFISQTIKKLLRAANDSVPEWLLQQFSRHTHHLLSNEQRYLEGYVNGLKEYALTVDHDIFNFNGNVRVLLDEILHIRGSVRQFKVMIQAAAEAITKKFPKSSTFFTTWLATAHNFQEVVNKVDINIGQSVQKRYSSASRRIKEQASNKIFEEFLKCDIYGLTEFRKYIQNELGQVDAKSRLELCQKAVEKCLEKRASFLSNHKLNESRTVICGVHEESQMIKKLVQDAHRYLAEIDSNVLQVTSEFHDKLLHEIYNAANPSLSLQMGSLKLDGQSNTHITELCSSVNGFTSLPTDELIQDAKHNMMLMDTDFDEIPTTIENNLN